MNYKSAFQELQEAITTNFDDTCTSDLSDAVKDLLEISDKLAQREEEQYDYLLDESPDWDGRVKWAFVWRLFNDWSDNQVKKCETCNHKSGYPEWEDQQEYLMELVETYLDTHYDFDD